MTRVLNIMWIYFKMVTYLAVRFTNTEDSCMLCGLRMSLCG